MFSTFTENWDKNPFAYLKTSIDYLLFSTMHHGQTYHKTLLEKYLGKLKEVLLPTKYHEGFPVQFIKAISNGHLKTNNH